MRRWVLNGNVLGLRNNEEEFVVPSATTIFSEFVDGETADTSTTTSKSMEVSELKFSRYPVLPRLTISMPAPHELPVLTLNGLARGQHIPLVRDDLKRGHLVCNGIWYPIESAGAEQLQASFARQDIEPGPISSLSTLLALKRAALENDLFEDATVGAPVPALLLVPSHARAPKGILATLYPYQLDGWRWLSFLISEGLGGVLADEMGLGKTLQVIAAICDLQEKIGATLIVAPGSILENWIREFSRFAPHLTVLKHHGATRTGRPQFLKDFDVVITSYDNVVRDNSLLLMVEWGLIVLDEAQFIKNPDTQRSKSVKRLRRRVGFGVTGTPLENRLLDLWSIFDFSSPGYLGKKNHFLKKFEQGEAVAGASGVEPLVSPLMLRRRVRDVAKDLPARIDVPQVVEFDEIEANAYELTRRRVLDEFGANATLVSLTVLRQFCAHPALVDPSKWTDPTSYSKFQRFHELLEEIFARGDKVIIFTSFLEMADIITRHIERNLRCFVRTIDGRLSIDDRQPLLDEFAAVSGSASLVLNPRAGGTGLNITAANHVIHYNLEWNPAVEDQASARAHRRGQKLPVTVHRLFVADSVEDAINDRLQRKRQLSAAAVVGVEGKDEDYGDIMAALARSPSSANRR